MGNYWREINRILGQWLTPAVRGIFLANLAVFILFLLLVLWRNLQETLFILLSQTPALVVGKFFLWQPVTYMFLHLGPFHLLMNMLVLWFFGPRLEYRWGTPAFLRFYFVAGIGAGLFHLVVSLLTGNAHQTMAGASGAIYGILLAYALYYPNDTVLLYFVFPVKIKYLMIFIGLLTFFSSVSGAQSGISHITHLGGLLVAFVYLRGWRFLSGGGGPRGGSGGGPRRGGPRRPTIIEVNRKTHPDFR